MSITFKQPKFWQQLSELLVEYWESKVIYKSQHFGSGQLAVDFTVDGNEYTIIQDEINNTIKIFTTQNHYEVKLDDKISHNVKEYFEYIKPYKI